jgi:cytochrome c-type biogenesis protein CcmH/NrfG
VRLAPGDVEAWTNLGGAQRAAGDREAATRSYRQALGIDPKSAPAHTALTQMGAG